jgi:ABC-type uncharacterized transport system permease subunit
MTSYMVKKKSIDLLKKVYFPLISLIAAMLIGSIIIIVTGRNPISAYGVMINGAFGSFAAWDQTIVKAIPFMFTGLSYAIAKRCGIINLGAEGQFKIGALCAAIVGVCFSNLPIILHLSLTLFAGFFGGAIYSLIVAILKLRFGASELITTIMLNYVATNIVSYFVTGPIKDSASSSYPQTAVMAQTAQLPRLFDGVYRIHAGFLIIILALIIYYVFLWKTTKGYELRVVGLNPTAGKYAGMSIKRATLMSMFLAGGFAGIGGAIEIIAVQHRLMQTSFSVSYGFTGIAVALLGNNNPIGLFVSGILFGGLQSGSAKMQALVKVDSSIASVIQALVILLFAGRALFQWRKKNKSANKGIEVCENLNAEESV